MCIKLLSSYVYRSIVLISKPWNFGSIDSHCFHVTEEEILDWLTQGTRGHQAVCQWSCWCPGPLMLFLRGSRSAAALCRLCSAFWTTSSHWSSEISLAHDGTLRDGNATAAIVLFTSSTWSTGTQEVMSGDWKYAGRKLEEDKPHLHPWGWKHGSAVLLPPQRLLLPHRCLEVGLQEGGAPSPAGDAAAKNEVI